jgi:uncharacterized protein YbjT (DUF2867 family)
LEEATMRILVLGGYGLIGLAVVRRLLAAGHEVTALGRSVEAARVSTPRAVWIARDIASLRAASDWVPLLRGLDAVVNCAGALQDGLRDDLSALQSAAMIALFRACTDANVRRIVQISAPGADPNARTAFMRTKGEADAALSATSLEWVILRPGLVFAPTAYGATGLIRGLASVPIAIPIFLAAARVQTVGVDEVANAVLTALEGRVPAQSVYDLVEEEAHTLAELLHAVRAWLGRPSAPMFHVPGALGRFLFGVGDALGWLGWRTPMRTTALLELKSGILGDPSAWTKATGERLSSLAETLQRLPSTVQERWYGRLWLLKPVVIATLSAFLLLTGVIALAGLDAAAGLFEARGATSALARATVGAGGLLDIALGILVLARRGIPVAAVGMIATSFVYLGLGTFFAADLWLDPLGPYLKVLPGMVLALVTLALAEER